jgi:hypothetical protein
MALVYRNGRPYLYRSVRKGGRVTSEYQASGESALLIAAADRFDRIDEKEERERERQERREADEVERALDDLTEWGLTLARNALIAAGYHQHHRGEWRRKRGNHPCDA